MRRDESGQTYLETLKRRSDVQAVLMLPDSESHVAYREGAFYLIVVNQPLEHVKTRCLLVRDRLIVEQKISVWELERGVVRGLDERMVGILQRAEVVWEKEGYVNQVKTRLCRMTGDLQKKQMCSEYSRLLRFFYETKEYLQQGMVMDAYHALVMALQAWARHIVYEAGEHPSGALWSQVKQLDPSVYKLYEELSLNAEALNKRIELLVLAIEFWLSSNLKESVRFLLEVMATRKTPWRLPELIQHPEIKQAGIEIPFLLEKMVQRSLIQEVVISTDDDFPGKEIGFILLE